MAFRLSRGLLPILGLSMILPLASMQAGANNNLVAAEGKIAGKVVDADGKPVADLDVNVLPPRRGRPGGPGNAAPAPAAPADPKSTMQDPPPAPPGGGGPGGGGGGRRQPPKPVATGKTDKDGAFSITVPVGEYTVSTMKMDGETRWMARTPQPITVKEGETVTVDLKLIKAPAGRGPGGGGGGGGMAPPPPPGN